MSEYDQALVEIFKKVVKKVSQQVYDMLLEFMDDIVYASSPEVYISGARFGADAGTLRGSFVLTEPEQVGNMIVAQIYHDYNLLDHAPWNFVHGSNYYTVTDDIRPILLEKIIIGGGSGDFFGPGWWQESRDFWTPFVDWTKDGTIEHMLRSEFALYGIKYG